MTRTPQEFNSVLSPMGDLGESLPIPNANSHSSLRTSLPIRLAASSIDDIMQGLDKQVYNSDERETIFKALRKFNHRIVKRVCKEETTTTTTTTSTPTTTSATSTSTSTTTTATLATLGTRTLGTRTTTIGTTTTTTTIATNNKQEILMELIDIVCKPNITDLEYRCGRDYTSSYKLGEGAFGTVRQCEDNTTGKQFAQKLIHNAKYKADELAIQAKLSLDIRYKLQENGEICCGVVQVLGAIRQSDMVYLFMEIMEDGSLGDMLRNAQGTLNLVYIMWYFRQILEGLSFIHSRRIIHLDIKADNILIQNEDYMKIADFGLARQIPEMKDAVYDGFFGTPHFMAPEVIRNELISTKSDMWAVGGVLFELMTGKAPWTGVETGKILFTVGKERVELIHKYTRPSITILEELSNDFHEEHQFNCDALNKLLTIFDMCFEMVFRKRASADELLDSEALTTLFSIIGFGSEEDDYEKTEEITTEDEVVDF